MTAARNQPTYDFLTDPSVAPKRTARSTLRTSSVSKPDENNEALRAQLYKLQYEVESLKQERELAGIQHEEALRSVQAKAEADFRRAQASELSTNASAKRLESLAAELQQNREHFKNEQVALASKARLAQEESRNMKEEADELRTELASQERHFKHELRELESRVEDLLRIQTTMAAELESKTKLLESTQQKLTQHDSDAAELEAQLLQMKSQGTEPETLAVVKRELSEQVAHIRQLELANRSQLTELKKFREQQKAIEVVEEEKRDLRSKVEQMKGLRNELSEAQLQRQILEDERKTWTAYLENLSETESGLRFNSPEDLAKAYTSERLERAALLEKLGNVTPEISLRDEMIQSLESEKAKLREEVVQLKVNGEDQGVKAKNRLERQRTLAIKEAEYLRAQMKAIDEEESGLQPEKYDEQRAQRIHELEEIVDNYRQEVQTLHEDISKLESSTLQPQTGQKRVLDEADDARIGQLSRKNRKLQEQLSQLTTSNALLQRDLEAQKSQVTSLKSSSRTRILELRSNPTSNAEAVKQGTLDSLKAENRALLAQIEGDKSITQVPRASIETLRAEIAERDQTIADKDKQALRLRQVFAAKSLEFREAVASLLGYKLDFMPNGRVRMTSMFHPGLSEDEGGDGVSNSIVFDGEQGTMKVSGGEKSQFAMEIRNLIEFWVEGKKEIPCLLAAMTLEFWEKSTKVVKV